MDDFELTQAQLSKSESKKCILFRMFNTRFEETTVRRKARVVGDHKSRGEAALERKERMGITATQGHS